MRQNGFSLLELMIAAAVILGVTGFAISNYSSFNQTERLRQSGKTFKEDLRLAQTRANAGIKPSTCVTPATLVGYTVSFPSGSSYAIQGQCSVGGPSGPVTTTVLPNGITFAGNPASITFAVLTGAAGAAQTITLSGVGHTYKIQVSASGDINDLGYQ